MAEELHQLLHAAGVTPPLLLVGHSLGGYNVRIYQRRYPEEVGGLVLVDSAHEAQWDRLPPEWADGVRGMAGWLRERAKIAESGLKEADVVAGAFTVHAPEWRDAHVAALMTPKPYLGEALESEAAFESARQVPSGGLGALPLVVLTARRSFDAFADAGLDVEPANRVWGELQDSLVQLSSSSAQLFSERDHQLHVSDPTAIVDAVTKAIGMVRAAPLPPSALGLPQTVLASRSTAEVDRLLSSVEMTYRAMNADAFVNLFSDDITQLDVSRRVHVKGRDRWLAWTRDINAAHSRMERRHRGRAVAGDWVVAEVEWSGKVRGEALGNPGKDLEYRYTGLVLMRLRGGRIALQLIYGDYASLSEQLASAKAAVGARGLSGASPEWVARYFESMVGTWIAENTVYRGPAEPFAAYGIEWKLGLGGKSLVGRLYAIREGKEADTIWEFREFWHHGDGALLATQLGSDGTYGVGPHVRKADGTMEMLQTFYAPSGAVTRVGHRSSFDGGDHVTRTFDVGADGTWKAQRTYRWRRKA